LKSLFKDFKTLIIIGLIIVIFLLRECKGESKGSPTEPVTIVKIETKYDTIVETVETLFDKHKINYDLKWTYNGLPFLTDTGTFIEAVNKAIEDVTGKLPELSTSGGTSDGRFIAPTGAQVIELGPCNATIHKVNESVAVKDLEELTLMYEKILENTLL